jgi:DNA-directed RNA polymerase subunit N
MIIPVRCWTCNKVIADQYVYYVNKAKTKPDDKDDIHNKELLDSIGLKRPCCRVHMISTVDMMEII